MLETRILEVFAESGLSRQEFASRIGISNAVMSHISSGRNKASMDLVHSILTHFPDISPDWLLLGLGQMKRSQANVFPEELKTELLSRIRQLRDLQRDLHMKIQDLENKIMRYP